MSTDSVITDQAEPIWTVTINLAHKRNALDVDDRIALSEALRAADSEEHCRAVILTGNGPVFCAGGDISAMTGEPKEARYRMHVVAELTKAIVHNSKPIIAAVEGGAFGLGLSVAAACDTVVAASDARFVASFGNLGLVADTGLHWTLAHRVGAMRAKQLILYRTELSAAEALTLGLVSRVVDPGSTVDTATQIGRTLLQTSPEMVAWTKKISAQQDDSLEAVLRSEAAAQQELLTTDEFRRRQREFTERRNPR